jgi:hypothetical protein
MIKKTIQYNDLEGNNVVDDFYFHLSEVELVEMETEVEGGLQVRMRRMIDGQEQTKVMATLRDIVARAVGRKSPDGRRFMKDPDDKTPLLYSDAYSKLCVELLTDTQAAIEFFNGIVPKDLGEKNAEAVAKQAAEAAEAPKPVTDLNFPGLSAEANAELAKSTATVSPVPESPLNAASFGRTDDRDLTDWRNYKEDELLALDDDLWNVVVGPVKAGMDKKLIALTIRRRNAKGAA